MDSPVRKWRKTVNMTQKELAQAAGVSQAHISKVEKGQVEVKGPLAEYLQSWRRDYGVAEIVAKQERFMTGLMTGGNGVTLIADPGCEDEDPESVEGLVGILFPETSIMSHYVEALLDKATVEGRDSDEANGKQAALWAACYKVYSCLQAHFPTEDDYQAPGGWVVRRVLATASDIRARCQARLRGVDFDEVWGLLVDTGAIEDQGDTIILPYLAGKLALLDEFEGHLGRGFQHIESFRREFQQLWRELDDKAAAIQAVKKKMRKGVDGK